MNQEELFNLFNKVCEKRWIVAEKDFPEDIGEDFFPDKEKLFLALEEISPKDVKFLILGQDPYPNIHTRKSDKIPGIPDANGIAFAVDEDREEDIPKSLDLIMKNVYPDGKGNPNLIEWIHRKGILLMNAALSVPRPVGNQKPAEMSGGHAMDNRWKDFTVSIIAQLKSNSPDVKMIACGSIARRYLCDGLEKAGVFTSCYHPSRPHLGGDKSFAKFWATDVGVDLRQQSTDK